MAVPVIQLSPKANLAPSESYYSIASEYPNADPNLQALLRFVLYPWAYAVTPLFPQSQPPQ